MDQDYTCLSYFGCHYFLMDYQKVGVIPGKATGADEINDVISCTLGTFKKEVKKYRTLNSNGWEKSVSLGQSQDDGAFECIRTGAGNPYIGEAGTDTYTKIKDWFMKATSNGGKLSPKVVVEVLPRGDAFEGTCYYVTPLDWTPGKRDTESGQEYSFTLSVFGPPVPVKVTVSDVEGVETWAFSDIASA